MNSVSRSIGKNHSSGGGLWQFDLGFAHEMSRMGFTLIETLISISIFVLISTVTIVGFRSAQNSGNLRQQANLLVSNLRRLQTMAQTNATVTLCSALQPPPAKLCASSADCTVPATCSDTRVPRGGYGILLSGTPTTSYQLFADMDGTLTFDSTYDVVIQAGQVETEEGIRISGYDRPTLLFRSAQATVRSGEVRDATGMPYSAYYCLQHPDISGHARRIDVVGETGQIREQSVSSCP